MICGPFRAKEKPNADAKSVAGQNRVCEIRKVLLFSTSDFC